MNNILFIAPPAAGKGTISDYLIDKYHYIHISTGELFRNEMNNNTEIGNMVAKAINHGDLVSDDIINEILFNKLKDLKGPFILDGYPRTINQAKELTKLFNELSITNYLVFNLDISKETLIKRMEGRVSCPKCNRNYNVYFESFKPKAGNLCDDCHVELISRGDDNLETFLNRYQIFETNATQLLNYYQELNVVNTINVNKDIENVLDDVERILSED